MSKKVKTFWVRSMYGFNTREPAVIVTMPGGETVQMPTEDARALALNILECADAAESDAFVFEFLQEKVGIGDEGGAMILNEFRKWREKKAQP